MTFVGFVYLGLACWMAQEGRIAQRGGRYREAGGLWTAAILMAVSGLVIIGGIGDPSR